MSEQIEVTHGEQIGLLYNSWTEAICALGKSLHYGYWADEHDQSSLEEAQEHLTDLVIAQLNATPGSFLLDVGCGMGEPALGAARATAASIVGINVSRKELEIATEKARTHLLSDRLAFHYADMTNIPFEPDSFDGAYAIESLFYVPNRADAIHEIYRVLKPGGRFVFTDPLNNLASSPQGSAEEMFWHGSFATLDYLTESLQVTGFTEIQVLDLTENVKKSLPLVQHRWAEFLKANEMNAQKFSSFTQALEADRDDMENGSRYLLIAALKPAEAI